MCRTRVPAPSPSHRASGARVRSAHIAALGLHYVGAAGGSRDPIDQVAERVALGCLGSLQNCELVLVHMPIDGVLDHRAKGVRRNGVEFNANVTEPLERGRCPWSAASANSKRWSAQLSRRYARTEFRPRATRDPNDHVKFHS